MFTDKEIEEIRQIARKEVEAAMMHFVEAWVKDHLELGVPAMSTQKSPTPAA